MSCEPGEGFSSYEDRLSTTLTATPRVHSLIADVCNMPVQLPYSHSASVVLGSAMLGAAAAAEAQNGIIDTQDKAEKGSHDMKERLWDIMVRLCDLLTLCALHGSEN